MDKKQQQPQNNTGGSGFLLGLILGVLITLLLTTKRGRQLLNEWTEKGINKLSDLEDLMYKQQSKQQTPTEDSDYVKKQPEQKQQERKLIAQAVEIVEEKPVANKQPAPDTKTPEKNTEEVKKPSITRRFFKKK